MKENSFRMQMENFRNAAVSEGNYLRYPYIVLERLHQLYESFDNEQRAAADRVFAEWLLSDDESKRFDAIALIRAFDVKSAVPQLEELRDVLAPRTDPGAPFEREKVTDLIGTLTTSDQKPGQRPSD
jgi:hypothetical protein